jgi:hypothetical protein
MNNEEEVRRKSFDCGPHLQPPLPRILFLEEQRVLFTRCWKFAEVSGNTVM